MSRTLGTTYEDIFQSFPSTNPDLNPIENLVLAIVEQSIRDYVTMLKKDMTQLDRSEISMKDVMAFLEEDIKPYQTYMDIDGDSIANKLKETVESMGKQKAADTITKNLARAKANNGKKVCEFGTHELEIDKNRLYRAGLNKDFSQNYNPENYLGLYTNLSDPGFSFNYRRDRRNNFQIMSQQEKQIRNDLSDTYNRIKKTQEVRKICNDYNIER